MISRPLRKPGARDACCRGRMGGADGSGGGAAGRLSAFANRAIRSVRSSKASCPRSIAASPIPRSPTRPGGWTTPPASSRPISTVSRAQARRSGCEGNGFFSLFVQPARPMRAAQRADPAGARQSRPHLERSPARSRAIPAPTARASAARSSARWRRTIAARNIASRRSQGGGFFDRLFGPGTILSSPEPTPHRPRHRAPTRRCACAPATASISRSPIRHRADQVRRGRADLPAPVPGRRGRALQPPRLRRGRQPGGVGERPPLYPDGQRLRLPQAVQSELQLQGRRPDLGRRPQAARRPDGRARRHRGHRGESQAAVAAAGRRAGQADQAAAAPNGTAQPQPVAATPASANAAAPAADRRQTPTPNAACARSARPSCRRIDRSEVPHPRTGNAGRSRMRPDSVCAWPWFEQHGRSQRSHHEIEQPSATWPARAGALPAARRSGCGSGVPGSRKRLVIG